MKHRFPLVHDLIVKSLTTNPEISGITEAEASLLADRVLDQDRARAIQLNYWLDEKGCEAERRALEILNAGRVTFDCSEEFLVHKLHLQLTKEA